MIDRASSPGKLWNFDWKQLEGSAAQASGGDAKWVNSDRFTALALIDPIALAVDRWRSERSQAGQIALRKRLCFVVRIKQTSRTLPLIPWSAALVKGSR